MTVYVVAGSTQEYERWLRGPGTAHETAVHPLTNARQINLMRREDVLVLLKDWQRRPDWRVIYNRMIATDRRGSR